jgi:hypothetical protein
MLFPEPQSRNYTFRKRYTAADNSTYVIEYVNTDNGAAKIVNEDKPLYVEWLAEPNTPEEVVFEPNPSHVRDMRLAAIRQRIPYAQFVRAVLEDRAGTPGLLDQLASRYANIKQTIR